MVYNLILIVLKNNIFVNAFFLIYMFFLMDTSRTHFPDKYWENRGFCSMCTYIWNINLCMVWWLKGQNYVIWKLLFLVKVLECESLVLQHKNIDIYVEGGGGVVQQNILLRRLSENSPGHIVLYSHCQLGPWMRSTVVTMFNMFEHFS